MYFLHLSEWDCYQGTVLVGMQMIGKVIVVWQRLR